MDKGEEKKKSYTMAGLSGFVMVGQLGLSLLMPLLICLFICYVLITRLNLGGWVFIPGFFFGLGGSAVTAYKVYLSESRKASKGKKMKRGAGEISLSRHL